MAGNNPTPTVTLQTTLADLINIAVKERSSKQIARFDMGQGREISVVAFVEDSFGYLTTIQTYEQARDEYANRVANAVAEDIRINGLPNPDHPQPFNLVKSSDGESLLPPDGENDD